MNNKPESVFEIAKKLIESRKEKISDISNHAASLNIEIQNLEFIINDLTKEETIKTVSEQIEQKNKEMKNLKKIIESEDLKTARIILLIEEVKKTDKILKEKSEEEVDIYIDQVKKENSKLKNELPLTDEEFNKKSHYINEIEEIENRRTFFGEPSYYDSQNDLTPLELYKIFTEPIGYQGEDPISCYDLLKRLNNMSIDYNGFPSYSILYNLYRYMGVNSEYKKIFDKNNLESQFNQLKNHIRIVEKFINEGKTKEKIITEMNLDETFSVEEYVKRELKEQNGEIFAAEFKSTALEIAKSTRQFAASVIPYDYKSTMIPITWEELQVLTNQAKALKIISENKSEIKKIEENKKAIVEKTIKTVMQYGFHKYTEKVIEIKTHKDKLQKITMENENFLKLWKEKKHTVDFVNEHKGDELNNLAAETLSHLLEYKQLLKDVGKLETDKEYQDILLNASKQLIEDYELYTTQKQQKELEILNLNKEHNTIGKDYNRFPNNFIQKKKNEKIKDAQSEILEQTSMKSDEITTAKGSYDKEIEEYIADKVPEAYRDEVKRELNNPAVMNTENMKSVENNIKNIMNKIVENKEGMAKIAENYPDKILEEDPYNVGKDISKIIMAQDVTGKTGKDAVKDLKDMKKDLEKIILAEKEEVIVTKEEINTNPIINDYDIVPVVKEEISKVTGKTR